MSDIKPWQIVVVVAALIVLAFSAWRMMGSDVAKGPSGYMTVDIYTGQLYLVKKGKAKGIMFPAKNPETEERTLYPVEQAAPDSDWELKARSSTGITNKMIEDSKVLVGGNRVKVLDEDPIVVVIR